MATQRRDGAYILQDMLLELRLEAIRRRKATRRLLLRLLLTAAAVYLSFGVVCGLTLIRGDSMEPALLSGDIALVFRLPCGYDRGDIVLLREDSTYIKRVAALPGETVDIDSETLRLLVDGVPAADSCVRGDTFRKTGCVFPLTLGPDEYFVLGDSRENSVDSRNFGPVHRRQLRGRIIALLRIEGKHP